MLQEDHLLSARLKRQPARAVFSFVFYQNFTHKATAPFSSVRRALFVYAAATGRLIRGARGGGARDGADGLP